MAYVKFMSKTLQKDNEDKSNDNGQKKLSQLPEITNLDGSNKENDEEKSLEPHKEVICSISPQKNHSF